MPEEGEDLVYTAGYADREQSEFVSLLTDHEVDRVLDVRALADSTQEGFSGEELFEALARAEIGYVHLAALGDFQPQPYREYMASEAFQEGYERLVDQARAGVGLILCACADASSCHRRFLAQRLREEGFEVVHLTPAGPKQSVSFEGA